MVVLGSLAGHTVDVSGGTLGSPQNRSASTDDDIFDLMVIERLEDARFVEIAVLVDRVTT